jgi:hypothetical protein
MESMARWMALCLTMTSENWALPRRHARTTARLPKAESPRTTMFPVAPTARAVAMAWATIRPPTLPEPVLPARSRIPAITDGRVGALIVVANGERRPDQRRWPAQRRRTLAPPIISRRRRGG